MSKSLYTKWGRSSRTLRLNGLASGRHAGLGGFATADQSRSRTSLYGILASETCTRLGKGFYLSIRRSSCFLNPSLHVEFGGYAVGLLENTAAPVKNSQMLQLAYVVGIVDDAFATIQDLRHYDKYSE